MLLACGARSQLTAPAWLLLHTDCCFCTHIHTLKHRLCTHKQGAVPWDPSTLERAMGLSTQATADGNSNTSNSNKSDADTDADDADGSAVMVEVTDCADFSTVGVSLRDFFDG